MKKRYLLYTLLIAMVLPACYDDLGNYDYHEINEIEVDSIRNSYSIDVDDSLCIVPIIRGSQYSDTSRFNYTWEMGRETLGNSHDLKIIVNMVPGYKFARYIVQDKETGVKKYYTFNVNVSSSTAGDLLMILSKYQGKAELSYLRLDKPANWAVNYFEQRFGEKLGTHPTQLSICYTELAAAYPFFTAQGSVMVLADNQIRLLNKSTLEPDSLTPYLTGLAYTSSSTADIGNYSPQFVEECIAQWRIQTLYNSTFYTGHLMQISGGTLYTASFDSNTGGKFSYSGKSAYTNGMVAPFGYWDDMSRTPDKGTNKNMGYEPGDFIMFDYINHRFYFANNQGGRTKIEDEDLKSFPDYNTFQWGTATNMVNNTSIAVLNNGNECRLILLQKGQDKNGAATKKLVRELSGGNVMNAQSKFYMMKYNENLFFTTGGKLYRYNLLDMQGGTPPSEKNLMLKLSDYGYDTEAKITALCVSRSEKTLLLGISRYGEDAEASGEEAKGDILWFDLDATSFQLVHQANKSTKGVSGIPVEVKVKYQTHWYDGFNLKNEFIDNI